MKFLKYGLGISALLVIALIVAWQQAEPAPLPEHSESAALLAPGAWQTQMREFDLVDTTRPTDANGDFAGAPERRLHTRVWFPVSDAGGALPAQAMPLIVYSHGFMGNSSEPTYLAEYLASHGYVIAAADFPLTNTDAPGGANVFDVMNQPGDVSFLIDTLLAWNKDPGSSFHQRIDPQRIAIAGLSLGGMTTTLAAYHPRVRDPRVKAAVSIAGPFELFGRAFFANSELPFMMLAGDVDAMVPYQDNALPVLERVNNAWLITVAGGSHIGFAEQASTLRWLDNGDSVGCFFIRDRTPQSSDDTSYFDRIGSEQEGILRGMKNRLCERNPLPPAISPLLQHRITMLAVRAFFESELNPDAAMRERFRRYLAEQLAPELGGVRIARSDPHP